MLEVVECLNLIVVVTVFKDTKEIYFFRRYARRYADSAGIHMLRLGSVICSGVASGICSVRALLASFGDFGESLLARASRPKH